MRAAFYTRTGPARHVLEVGEQPDPEPGRSEVLVALHASGINPADVKRRAGWLGAQMDHPLVIPHADGAGVIEAVGDGIDAARVGERVWLWNAQGGYGEAGRAFGTAAEKIALPAEQAVPLPEALDFREGACLGVPAMTAYLAIFGDGEVAGKTVLIQGAGGGVGLFAAQFALHAGAHVLATAGHDGRASLVREAGIETILDRHAEDLAEQILAATDGRGVDRIVEVDFGANLPVTAKVLANGGVVASYSSSTDPTPTVPYYAFAARGASVRFVQGFRVPLALRPPGQALIAQMTAAGQLRIPIGLSLPLDQIAEAHQAVETGQSVGQTVLDIA